MLRRDIRRLHIRAFCFTGNDVSRDVKSNVCGDRMSFYSDERAGVRPTQKHPVVSVIGKDSPTALNEYLFGGILRHTSEPGGGEKPHIHAR